MPLLNELTLTQVVDGLQKKDFSSEELTRACLDAMEKQEPIVHAFLHRADEGALREARTIDERRAKGEDLPLLAGVPIALKDVLATAGMPTTAASKILESYIPPYDATAAARLREQGTVFLGKTNLDEFAHGASTEYSAFGPTHNPHDAAFVPGGSSGGSAAAIAAHECIAALGTDTGGSVRQPASFCGVVGLKPTYGRVSRYGLFSMTSSTDVVGTLTKTVEDTSLLLQVIAGEDAHDATTASVAVPDYRSYLRNSTISKLRIGVPKEYFAVSGMHPDVEKNVRAALTLFEKHGAIVQEVSLPHTAYAVPTYYITTPSEISANLARYDGVRYGYSEVKSQKSKVKSLESVYSQSRAHRFGVEVKRRIMLGTYALSSGYYDAYYAQAAKVRTRIREDFEHVFDAVDVLLTPTTPHPAFRIGEKTSDPLQMYLEDIFVTAVSLAGLPAISVPCGMSTGTPALPIGLQIIGKHFDETTILSLAYQWEQMGVTHDQ